MNLVVKCIKTTSIFTLLFGFIFSLSAFGQAGDLINCEGSGDDYNTWVSIVRKDPNNVKKIYYLGVEAYCSGRKKEGIRHIENAANGGHIMASRIMGLYHKTDGTLDSDAPFTQDPDNYNKMLGYYEQAARQIELVGGDYPEGATSDMRELEQKAQVSAKVYVSIPHFYLNGYNIALVAALEEGIPYVDTKTVLAKMKEAANRCLRRPPLAAWKSRMREVAHALRVRCKAMLDFASGALPLEEERIRVARSCSVALRECSEHQVVVDELIQLSMVMADEKKSVPLI